MNPFYSALITVGVATFTTLIVEWMAKPTLEARKERILEHQRNIRRAATIAIDQVNRIEEYNTTGQKLNRPEQTDEFRSLQPSLDTVRGRRNREVVGVMTNAFLFPGVDPHFPWAPGHPRTEDTDARVASWAAHFILTPRSQLIRRRRTYRYLKELLNQHDLDDQGREPVRSGRQQLRQQERRKNAEAASDSAGQDPTEPDSQTPS